MIKNERQYRITKTQVEKFVYALTKLKEVKVQDVDPIILAAEKKSLESQLLDLQREIQEYDDLRTGKIPIPEFHSIEEIPNILIKTRIALGLSQKDLAERIGLQEQQIQRYESTDYESASVSRIREIINALNLEVGEKLLVPENKIKPTHFFKRISETGLDRNFVMKKILPQSLAARFNTNDVAPDLLGLQAAAYVGRIFGWKPDLVFSSNPLVLDTTPIASVRFKVSKSANQTKINVYTVYARYIAMLVSQATNHISRKTLPTDPQKFRDDFLSSYGSITFENLVRHIWNLGIPIIALDPISFHAACFRDSDRSIIVLTQKTSSEARWMFNLLHEFYHAAKGTELVTESEDELRNSDEERIASQFADFVLLGKNPHDLATRCLDKANWDISTLKKTIQKVANDEKVRVDVLANYIAYRLSTEQNSNWWGTAESLQKSLSNARGIIRDNLLQYSDFSRVSEPDLELLRQSFSEDEVQIHV